jgi:hypothetical protein
MKWSLGGLLLLAGIGYRSRYEVSGTAEKGRCWVPNLVLGEI